MKNFVVTLLLAMLVVLTALSVRHMVAGSASNTTLVAIGTSPVPLPPPPPPPPPPPSK